MPEDEDIIGIGGRATSGMGHNPPRKQVYLGNDPYLAITAASVQKELPPDDRDLSDILRRNET
ncbi:MAG: hypothetical protein ACK4SL_03430 [Candidatus Paceibacteria bacterium]